MNFWVVHVFLSIFACAIGNPTPTSDDVTPECHCVPPNMCLDNDVSISEGAGLLDIRLDKGVCYNYYDICCQNPLAFVQQPPAIRKCGTQTLITLKTRITSDSRIAQFGEAPWTVAVLLQKPVGEHIQRIFKCGGSLIHPQVVMTVAHCVVDVTNTAWTVRAGEWNTRSLDEPLPYQEKTVQEIFIHPLFDAVSLKYDVALLILVEPVQLADNVGVICLPPAGLQLDRVKCMASGWGKDSFKKGEHSTILKMIELPLVRRDDCQRSLRNTRLGKFYQLHSSFLCAGGELNKDTCVGDGGSPLVCPIPGQPGRYLQMGIVSWGIGCGENDTPGVYVNVPQIRNWVDNKLRALNLDIGFYNY